MVEDHRDDIDSLQTEAVGVLRRFLGLKEPSPAALGQAKVAATAFSSVTRLRSTQNAEHALNYQMARDIASDKTQLQRYISMTMPNSALVRAMPEPERVAASK